jgi:hypothetical protein
VPQVAWIFAQRLAGHSRARIARALNDAAVPCPSAADPGRNPHRSGTAWSRKQGAADSPVPAQAADLISYLRAKGITLTYDPGEHTIRAGTHDPVSVTIDRRTPTGRS